MVKISYAITVCNELEEIKRLVEFLLTYKRDEDEIVILMDNNGTEEVWDYLLTIESKLGILNRILFNKDFSKFKNHLNSLCSGDYIFNIDADEIPSITLIYHLPGLIELNPDVKAFALPRVNTVEGLTQEHIEKWRWNINSLGWVNYPDYQIRIYKNDHGIYWEGKVHERLNIWEESWPLPMDVEDWVLYHHKVISRQEKQNELYSNI
jgi:cellulose synthase/poly-beta-1,6-N-acetylglucosamine synthase-like glycosyltransferase